MRSRLPLALALSCGTLAMAGCPAPTMTEFAQPASWEGAPPSLAPSAVTGPSLDDAYHQVQRYMTQHYPEAVLVRAQGLHADSSGRITTAGTWGFTFLTQPAPSATNAASSPSVQIQAIIPSLFEGPLLTLTLTGALKLLAPEVAPRTAPTAAIAYDRVLPAAQAIAIAQGFGMDLGSGGIDVVLGSDPIGTAVYELDNSLTYAGSPLPPPEDPKYGAYGSPAPVPTPQRLGKFVVEAYTGNILGRPDPY